MSSTRLLVLGVVRIFQPVNGYLVRRELLSWNVDRWAHVNPGSIYHALRTLAREGLLSEVGGEDTPPAKGSYRLTSDGETALDQMLREAFWRIDPYTPEMLLAGLCFFFWLPREELIAALENRTKLIDGEIQLAQRTSSALAVAPERRHVPELFSLTSARLEGERAWAEGFASRLRRGEYLPVEHPAVGLTSRAEPEPGT